MHATAAELDQILAETRPRLLALDEASANGRSADGKWSKKEILGHLIDSAANNHQRFVRLQIEKSIALPGYDQPNWVRIQNYAGRPWNDLVELWSAYNRHLAHIMRHADTKASDHVWNSPEGDRTLAFLMADYLHHMRHHLNQIL